MTAMCDVELLWDVDWHRPPPSWREDEDEDSGDGVVYLTCWAGDTLVARGEFRPGTILGGPGIWGIFVDEDHRRRGHAREVMRRLIEHARIYDFGEVLLHVDADNTPAIRLYESLGFVEYHPGTVVTMRLDIAC